MENTTSGIKAWQWAVTAVVIIVLIVIGIMVFGNKGAEAPVVTPEETAITDTTNTSANRIVMSDQYPGNVAYISSVQLANAGFVVIQKNTAGKPGEVIGSAYVAAGINPAKVTLSQPMIDGSMYYASIYRDNGDKKFDIATDEPVKDASGNIIMKTFKATISAGAEIKG